VVGFHVLIQSPHAVIPLYCDASRSVKSPAYGPRWRLSLPPDFVNTDNS